MLAAFFALFVLFLYGPMSAICILSFQGPTAALTFPLQRRLAALVRRPVRAAARRAISAAPSTRSLPLALIVHGADGGDLGDRRAWPSGGASAGSDVVFYLAIASLIVPRPAASASASA